MYDGEHLKKHLSKNGLLCVAESFRSCFDELAALVVVACRWRHPWQHLALLLMRVRESGAMVCIGRADGLP